jgi:hypothetical protein
MSECTVDPERVGLGPTGIYVRAMLEGKWGSYDIAELDRDSLSRWLRSRGGSNQFAEHVVMLLLGHSPEASDVLAEDIAT